MACKKTAKKEAPAKAVVEKEKAKPMTKSALVAKMADEVGLQKKDVVAVLDKLVEITYKETKKVGVFVIPGLGRTVVKDKKACVKRNPQTGEMIKKPATKALKFRFAKAAKDAIVPPKVKKAK